MAEAGICPACRTTQLAVRGSPLCPACTDSALQTAPRPLWVFDSPLLRAALAQVNLSAVPAIVRAASGLSQTDLAAIVGWSRGALGLYERGQRGAVFDVRLVLQFADAVDMPREALLPLLLGDADAELAVDFGVDEMGADVDRRSFSGLTAGVAVAAILPEPTIPSRITAAHVKYLQACVDSLYSRDQAVGGAALLRSGLRQWRRARRMLKESSYTQSVGREMLSITGYLADVNGWLAFDAANVPLARRLYSAALEAATGADDPVLAAWVLAHQSGLASYQASMASDGGMDRQRANSAREGLLLANRAADEARYVPMPGLHGLIALRGAYAASLLRGTTGYDMAVGRARRELDRGPGIDEPAWMSAAGMSAVGEANILEEQARGALNFGAPARAEKLYRALLDRPWKLRARAYFNTRVANCLLRQGARREAVAEGTVALEAFESGVTSVRTLNDLRPVRVAAGEMAAEEFCVRFDAVGQTLSGVHPV